MTAAFAPQQASVAGQQTYGDTVFPYVLSGTGVLSGGGTEAALSDCTRWVAANRDELLAAATAHGGVLLRDFPTPTVEAFDAVVAALALENFPYDKSLSNAVRINRTPRVFSANEAPPEVRIFFHHEMAQTPLYPRFIMFFCEVAPQEGGATPLCRSDVLYERLQQRCPEFAAKCQRTGLRYTNVMPGNDDPHSGMGRSWQKTLGVQSREQAETRLRELNYSFRWLDDGCLQATTPVLPAVLEVSPGRKTFFNQMIAAYCGWKDERNDPSDAIRHGDGSKLDAAAVQVAQQLAEDLSFDHRWQVGDIVILDNTIAMHARRPFVGTRKVLASLAQMHTRGPMEVVA